MKKKRRENEGVVGFQLAPPHCSSIFPEDLYGVDLDVTIILLCCNASQYLDVVGEAKELIGGETMRNTVSMTNRQFLRSQALVEAFSDCRQVNTSGGIGNKKERRPKAGGEGEEGEKKKEERGRKAIS